jgi:hypothetical protein
MHFAGNQTLAISQIRAWQFLTDPEQVGKSVPGLKSIAVIDATHFNATVGFGVGSFSATFTLEVEWLEMAAPNRARMKVHGDAPGSVVDGESELKLSAIDETTTNLEWTADVNIGGKIASIAARLMNTVAQKLTEKFFKGVQKKMEGGKKRKSKNEKSEVGLGR